MVGYIKEEYRELQEVGARKISAVVHESSAVYSAATLPKQKELYPSTIKPRHEVELDQRGNLYIVPTMGLVGTGTDCDSIFTDLLSEMTKPHNTDQNMTMSEDSILSSRSSKKTLSKRKPHPPFGSAQPRFRVSNSVHSSGG